MTKETLVDTKLFGAGLEDRIAVKPTNPISQPPRGRSRIRERIATHEVLKRIYNTIEGRFPNMEFNQELMYSEDHGIVHLVQTMEAVKTYIDLVPELDTFGSVLDLKYYDRYGDSTVLEQRKVILAIASIGAMLHDIGHYVPGGTRENHNSVGARFVQEYFDEIIKIIYSVVGTHRKENKTDVSKLYCFDIFANMDFSSETGGVIKRAIINCIELHRQAVSAFDIGYGEYYNNRTLGYYDMAPAQIVAFADKDLTKFSQFTVRSFHYITRDILHNKVPTCQECIDLMVKHSLEKTVSSRIVLDNKYLRMLAVTNPDEASFWRKISTLYSTMNTSQFSQLADYIRPVIASHVKLFYKINEEAIKQKEEELNVEK